MDSRDLQGLMEAYGKVYAPVDEAVYGGEPKKPEAPKDDRMVVTAADKRGNTPAYQKFKAGHKGYKAADHLGEESVDEGMSMKDFKANRKKNERRAASDDAKKRGHVDRFTGKPYGTEEAASRRSGIHTPEKKPSRDAARDAARGETGHGGPLKPKKVRKAKAMGELGEGVIDEAVKGASPHAMEMRKGDAAERRAGIKPLSAKKGEEYAKYKMAQMAHSKRERMGEELDIFDVVLEFLQVEGYAETLEEAEWLMANELDAEDIKAIIETRMDPRGRPASGPMNVYAKNKPNTDPKFQAALQAVRDADAKKTPEQRKAELDAYKERQANK